MSSTLAVYSAPIPVPGNKRLSIAFWGALQLDGFPLTDLTSPWVGLRKRYATTNGETRVEHWWVWGTQTILRRIQRGKEEWWDVLSDGSEAEAQHARREWAGGGR